MKIRQLVVLIVVAAVLIGLAVWSSRKESRRTAPAQIGAKALPGLDAKVNDVDAIVVRSATETARVARVDGTWRVTGKHGYPADFSKVRDLLIKLADLKVAQSLRATPALLKDLQVDPSSAPERQALVIELLDKSGKSIASLRAGKTHMRSSPGEEMSPYGAYPDGRFVAAARDRVSLVAETLTEVSASDKNWMDSDLLNVNNGDLSHIEITGATTGVVRLDRPAAGGDLAVKDIPADKEADASKVSRVTSALSYLRFDDVADPTLTPAQTGLDKPVTFQAKTAKGQIYTVRVGKTPEGDSRRYAAFAIAHEAPPAPDPADTNAVAAAKAGAAEQAKLAADAKQLNAKLSPWVYLLNSYQTEALCMGQGDLLKTKEPEKKAPEAQEPATKAPEKQDTAEAKPEKP
jgi:hypothetical protein